MLKKNFFLIYINKFNYFMYIYIYKYYEIFIINYRENNDVENLYLNFTLNVEDCFGNHKTIELKTNGANIDVTDSNKNEYIK